MEERRGMPLGRFAFRKARTGHQKAKPTHATRKKRRREEEKGKKKKKKKKEQKIQQPGFAGGHPPNY